AAGLGRGAPGLCWKAAQSLLRPGASCVVVPVRSRRKGPWVPQWARELSPEERQRRLKAAAPIFPDERIERTFYLACTAEIMDPYVPPEGDARLTSLSKDGVKQQMQKLRQTAASQLALRKIKDHDPDFSTRTFPEKAQEIFIEAHNSLANFNKQKLHSLVTERCYPDMVRGNRYRTIRWRFLESLEPPRVVHVRCEGVMNRGNLYGQVTVRMHSRQVSPGRGTWNLIFIPVPVLIPVPILIPSSSLSPSPSSSWILEKKEGRIPAEFKASHLIPFSCLHLIPFFFSLSRTLCSPFFPADFCPLLFQTLMIPAPAPDPSQEHEKVK
ncbi:39S ribosomal protein L45, mitochondrial, partial [Parus major]|uniref:39S ribosomal protein L45, mitochondrial n=1 Tax=Parus major TaxID=9157 RepID=UPI001443923B